MRIVLPLPLRRLLLGQFLLSATLSSVSFAAEFMVDATRTTSPAENVYSTLQELAASGALSSGDTVVLYNDDSSLTDSLTIPVNFRSNDPEAPRTIDLNRIIKPNVDYSNSYLYNFVSKTPHDDYGEAIVLKMDSIILSGGDFLRAEGDGLSVNITGSLHIKDSPTDNAVISMNNNSYREYDKHSVMTLGDDVVFSNNKKVLDVHMGDCTIGDNAVFTGNCDDEAWSMINLNCGSITIGDNATFTGNYIINTRSGGAVGAVFRDSWATSSISVGANATFTGNYIFSETDAAIGGVIYTHQNYSGLYPEQYESAGTITIGSNAVFTRNYVYGGREGGGGAIYTNSDISFKDGAVFTGNYASHYGGALYVGGKLHLYALTKDVLFSGNMTGGTFTRHGDGTFSVEKGIANAIEMTPFGKYDHYGYIVLGSMPELTFAAAQGREIRFNDPITRYKGPLIPELEYAHFLRIPLELNRYTDEEGTAHDTDGTIVFSGELYQGEEAHLVASRYNDFVADTTLHGGTLLLEHEVVFGRKLREILEGSASTLSIKKGVLEITGGSEANALNFTLSGPGAVLRPGERAFINAETADLSRGFTFDMRHQLQAGPSSGPGLILSALDSFTAGGHIGVADTGENAPFFYADRAWKQDRVFHVLTDAEHTRQGDFEGAYSQATGSARVDSPYTYTGSWSHQWTDADGDGYAEQLQLVWKADGTPISRVDPEQVGELAFNSLWSSASNAAALGGPVLSRLSAPRLSDRHARNLWGMGLGDFARQRSRGGVDGYDYNGGGYSVGADSGFGGDSGIWGIAFGQLYGHARSRDFQGKNTQETRMGSLYWGRLMEESNRARWIFKGSLTFAETDNRMTSRLKGAPTSTGKWNNETWLAQMEISRTADCAGGWSLTPFVRMEFTHGRQDAFREEGGYGREFGGAVLRRLSIPVGLETGRSDEWKGMPWTQTLRVCYVGDVLQDVPCGTVCSPYSGMEWKGRAVNPGRHGFRAEYDTNLQCNERWNVYAGYGVEVRGSSVYHRVNAGVARSF